nr:twin-arginine translocase subunit TatC [Micromonospora sp. DSM 115978]
LSKGLELLLGFGGDGLVSVLDVNKYLSYVIAMLLVFGLSFEIPLLITMLNLAGVVSTAKLRSWRRPQIFLTFLFAAIVTPSQDPFTLLALGLPMIVLFELALLIGWLNDRRKRRNGDGSPYSDLADDETSPLDLPDHETAARGSGLSDSDLSDSDRRGSDRGDVASEGQTVGASAAPPTSTKHDDVT